MQDRQCISLAYSCRLSSVSQKDLQEPLHEEVETSAPSMKGSANSSPSAPARQAVYMTDSMEEPPQGFPIAEEMDDEDEGMGLSAVFAE